MLTPKVVEIARQGMAVIIPPAKKMTGTSGRRTI